MGLRARGAVVFGVAAWLGLVGFGLRAIYAYSTTPGARGDVLETWPSDSAIARDPSGATLVMFVHPDCPCTAASLDELRTVVRGSARVPAIAFVVELGATGGDDWSPGRGFAGASRTADRDGVEARRFGAKTSGYVVLYDAAGQLRFAGGITGSRGHSGDNVGRQALLAALGGTGGVADHPVFGCSFEDDAP